VRINKFDTETAIKTTREIFYYVSRYILHITL
jgi:hypothetical protein